MDQQLANTAAAPLETLDDGTSTLLSLSMDPYACALCMECELCWPHPFNCWSCLHYDWHYSGGFHNMRQPQLSNEQTLGFPTASEEVWNKRIWHRQNAIQIVKGKREYLHSREQPNRPTTPDPLDRNISKRDWEKGVQKWQAQLRSFIRQKHLVLDDPLRIDVTLNDLRSVVDSSSPEPCTCRYTGPKYIKRAPRRITDNVCEDEVS